MLKDFGKKIHMQCCPLMKVGSYLQSHRDIGDWIVAAVLALNPLLQFYCGFLYNASADLNLLLSPYLFLLLLPTLRNFRLENLRWVAPLIIFFLYKLLDHGTSFIEMAQVAMFCFLFLCLSQNCIDIKKVRRTAVFIAAIAGPVLIFQYICYYLFGFHFQMVPVSLLTEKASQWVLLAETGLHGVDGRYIGFYRPSAFFLEPSHLFLYSFVPLFLSLFKRKRKRIDMLASLSISFGLLLSTSGMGIVVLAAAWGLFLLLRDGKEGFSLTGMRRYQNWLSIMILCFGIGLSIAFVPFIRRAVLRIPGGAISVRTKGAWAILQRMTVFQWIFGCQDSTAALHVNMPGFMATVYKYGIVGVAFSYAFFLNGLRKFSLPYFLVALTIIGVSFFSAQTHGSFYLLYYVLILREGFLAAKGRRMFEFWSRRKHL